MAEHVIGIVDEVNNNGKGKGSSLRVNGLKYGIWDPSEAGMDDVEVGNQVSFRFKVTSKNGIDYKNIQGKVTKTTGDVANTAPARGTGSGYRRHGEEGGFPIHARAYERALDRREAVRNAVAALGAGKTASEYLTMAKEFEAYTTGEDLAIADAALAFKGESDSVS